MRELTVGTKAPPFTLPDQDGKPVSLADQAGRWVVLYFYPKDDTPGCTVQACDFTSALRDFHSLEAHVLGCSPDGAESHQKFIEKHRLGITLLSDPDHTVMDQYGAWGEKSYLGKTSMGVLRSTVIIDPAGNVAWHWPSVKADGHVSSVREKLQDLRGL